MLRIDYYAAPDCSKSCQYGGKALANGTQNCQCATSRFYITFIYEDTVYLSGGLAPYSCKSYAYGNLRKSQSGITSKKWVTGLIGYTNQDVTLTVRCWDSLGNSDSQSITNTRIEN